MTALLLFSKHPFRLQVPLADGAEAVGGGGEERGGEAAHRRRRDIEVVGREEKDRRLFGEYQLLEAANVLLPIGRPVFGPNFFQQAVDLPIIQ